MRASKTLLIATHEVWTTVRSKGFLLATLGAPLLVLLPLVIGIGIAAIASSGMEERFSRTVGIVDRSGLLSSPGGAFHERSGTIEFELPPAIESPEIQSNDVGAKGPLDSLGIRKLYSVKIGKEALAHGEIQTLVVIHDSFLDDSRVSLFNVRSDLINLDQRYRIARFLRVNLIRILAASDSRVAVLDRPISFVDNVMNAGRFEERQKTAGPSTADVAKASVMLMLIVILTKFATVAYYSLREERESKLLDILLSSVSADELLRGKVISAVSVAILQMAIWAGMAIGGAALLLGPDRLLSETKLDPFGIGLACLFTIMGLVLSNFVGVFLGSIFRDMKDSQAASSLVKIYESTHMIVACVVIMNGDNALSSALSMVPPFSAPAMVARLCQGNVGMTETAVSFALLGTATLLVANLAARLFKAGLLMHGKALRPSEILSALLRRA